MTVWTEKQVDILCQEDALFPRKPMKVIAEMIGRTSTECTSKLQSLILKTNTPVFTPVNRECLYCEKPFVADGLFIRLCKRCKERRC
jgi:hypothetical protein|tara:strand:+ start:1451 stop:1711 length:261 start_codon:yes stop_codon:yes gene_type:complete